MYWVLWFVISTPSGNIIHFPVDEHWDTQAICESHLDEWRELITSQFPDDPVARVYCEEFNPIPKKEI